MIGLNAPGECRPGQIVAIETINTSEVELAYTTLLIPDLYRVHFPFDVVRFAIDGRDQIQGPIAAALFDGLGLSGDPIVARGTVLLEVMCRAQQANLCFQGALLVRYFVPLQREAEPAETDTEPAPVLEEVARTYAGRLAVAKLDVDANPEITQKFGIRGIPTLILFKDGKVQAQKVGALSKAQLTAFVDSNL